VPGDSPHPTRAAARRSYRWPIRAAAIAVAVAVVFLVLPALAGVPARLVEGCGKWIAAAGVLELLSAVGFVFLFKLVFAGPVSWRRSVPAALRALAASTVLPAGGLIGPTMGAWSASIERPSVSALTRSTVTFVILTNAPGAIALAALGMLLWLGLPGDPHQIALTLLPAALAGGLLIATWLAGRPSRRQTSPPRRGRFMRRLAKPVGDLSDGITEARELVTAGNWKLTGALAYYAFDSAVLWAAFHAYGHAVPVGVVAMGYLVGSLAGALPIPAGLGVVDGGLVGALVLYGAPVAPAAAAVLLYRGISLSLPVALGAFGWLSGPATNRPVAAHKRRAGLVGLARAKRRVELDLVTADFD
jgi:uncharacterized membrane protein YbhN (UPF0104 family)